MLNSKNFIVSALIGGIGGFVIGVIGLAIFVSNNFWSVATILGKPEEQAVAKSDVKTVFIPRPDYFSDAIAKIEPKVVAIQSFSGGALIRSGSGTVITQDGLIATLNSVVPSAQTLQVIIGGKAYLGKIVFRNYNANIAIISVAAFNLQTAKLKKDLPVLGQKLLLFAKIANFNKDIPMVAEALVSQVNIDGGQFKVSLPYDQFMYGAAILDNNGDIIGLLDFRNQKPVVVTSKLLEETLVASLTKAD